MSRRDAGASGRAVGRVAAGIVRATRARPVLPAVHAGPPAPPGAWLEEYDPGAWKQLRADWESTALTDVDRARLAHALALADGSPDLAARLSGEIRARGEAAALHSSGLRDLPVPRRALHNLTEGQLRLGTVIADGRNHPPTATGDFGIDHDVLRTSMLVLGPPGAGKTQSFAVPIVEHLSLSALANKCSVVVIDPKGDDFDYPGWFDVTLDAENPSCGFSLFGGSADPDEAADRLASALLPPNTPDDASGTADAVRNAVYAALAPLHAGLGRWPTVPELVRALRADASAVEAITDSLRGHPEAERLVDLLAWRRAQAAATRDPAAGALERLALLDRPALRRLFDHPSRSFAMREINTPVRVRVVLPESRYPEVARVLARLVVAQFVQVASATDTNRGIFKALVVDEAGRFVDEHVARGVQRLRSANAGLVLLAQSLAEFPPAVANTIFGAAGCRAVVGGLHPVDAEVFSTAWGEQIRYETTVSYSETTSRGADAHGPATGTTTGRAMSVRRVDAARWSVSDLASDLAPGRAVVSLTRSDGRRVGPVHVDLRGSPWAI